MEALFCCFRGLGPKISAITGLGASVLSFAFLIEKNLNYFIFE